MTPRHLLKHAAAGSACLLAVLVMAGCASPSARRQARLDELHTQNVTPEVYAKFEQSKPLSLADIEHLVAQGVNDDTILYHLKRTRTIYRLTAEDVERLDKAGASEKLVRYLIGTPWGYRPYYGPYYPYGPYYYWGYPYPYPYGPYYYCPPYYPAVPYYHHHGLWYRRLP